MASAQVLPNLAASTRKQEHLEVGKKREPNKELSQKFEGQTQRVELLTAQIISNEKISTRAPDPHVNHIATPYADEGDEGKVIPTYKGW